MRIKLFLAVFLLLFLLSGLASAQNPQAKPDSADAPMAGPAKAGPGADDSELGTMKADVGKMNVLLNQMRTNLAFVQTTQTPLKHQFELEIDMWQTLLSQMNRRIDRMQRKDSQHPTN